MDEMIVNDFSKKCTISGKDEVSNSISKLYIQDPIKSCESKSYNFIPILKAQKTEGDTKPPFRLQNTTPPKTSKQIAADLQNKMEQSFTRRQTYLNSIVEKSKLNNEKVTKIREKVELKRCENILNTWLRQAIAEATKQKLCEDKSEKFRKYVEHVKTIRNRKAALEDKMHIKEKSKNAGTEGP